MDLRFYIDAWKEHVRIPSPDVSNFGLNAFMLFPVGHAMADECGARVRTDS
jgi:hypothetical protein